MGFKSCWYQITGSDLSYAVHASSHSNHTWAQTWQELNKYSGYQTETLKVPVKINFGTADNAAKLTKGLICVWFPKNERCLFLAALCDMQQPEAWRDWTSEYEVNKHAGLATSAWYEGGECNTILSSRMGNQSRLMITDNSLHYLSSHSCAVL